MAMASPTPMPSFGGPRRQASRQMIRQIPSRPHLNRQNALPPSAPGLHTMNKTYSLGDSSDDDIAPPIFNKATNRLLEGEHSILDPSSPAESLHPLNRTGRSLEIARHSRAGSAEGEGSRMGAEVSISRESTAYPRRVVRLSSTPGSSARRSSSLQSTMQNYDALAPARGNDPESPVTTPAQIKRTVRIPAASTLRNSAGDSSGHRSSRLGSGQRSGESDHESPDNPASSARLQAGYSSVSKYGGIGRGRFGDDTGVPQSSLRVKRVGAIQGSYLRGPARRGRRRQSEEELEQESELHEGRIDSAYTSQETQYQEAQHEVQEPSHSSPAREPEIGRCEPKPSPGMETVSVTAAENLESYNANRSHSPIPTMSIAHHMEVYLSSERSSQPKKSQQPVFKIPPHLPKLPSSHDQENETPLSKHDKLGGVLLLEKLEKASARPQVDEIHVDRVEKPLDREILASRSRNTPKRPAPPAPPKMSVLETATATAGASTSQGTKKRNAIRVNGKVFTRLDVLGRGGSSKVWRVMAENGKFWALKRVALEDADESAIRGFKGEIDLLRKLEGNDRVVRLLDYEMNDEKQTLTVLMEMGDLDFNKMLTLRFNAETSVFDASFTRHYWKEMLECILTVHERDIVHSDLKPANFVLVQGRLKLIDFGIANAIETDETVNVHRDTQIGTTNYMSPESLIEASELPHNKGTMPTGGPKLWKIGKPSDIWSLGCILYQMSYGRQPFAHIQNQMSRCRAIIDFGYAIEYPTAGLGGATLPKSLIKTMKRCLNRDLHARPTVEELLDPSDPFLYPGEYDEGVIPMTEELLGRILQSVAAKCRDRTPTEAEVLKIWPAGYFANLRKGDR